VNKTELIDHVVGKAALDKRTAAVAVDAMLHGVMSSVKSGDKVSILGFGTFNPSSRSARTGRNPQTGATVKIAASKGVRFAPGTAFKGLLNSKGGAVKKAASAKKAPAKKAASAKKAPAKKAPAKRAVKSAKKK
jgi:DNA-binding protein HU-beta